MESYNSHLDIITMYRFSDWLYAWKVRTQQFSTHIESLLIFLVLKSKQLLAWGGGSEGTQYAYNTNWRIQVKRTPAKGARTEHINRLNYKIHF